MNLKDATMSGLFIVAAALAACGRSPPTSEGAWAVRPAPAVNANNPTAESDASGVGALGLPLYPGMQALVEARHIPIAKRGELIESDFKSADPTEKTAAFYREQLSKKYGEDTQFLETPLGEGMVRLQATNGEARNIEVLIGPDGTGSIVGVRTLGMTN